MVNYMQKKSMKLWYAESLNGGSKNYHPTDKFALTASPSEDLGSCGWCHWKEKCCICYKFHLPRCLLSYFLKYSLLHFDLPVIWPCNLRLMETSASALHEATAYSCQFWILLWSKRMWHGHKFVPNNVLHLFLSSRRHDRNPDVKSLNNIKPIQIIFIIIIYMFTIFCDRLKPSKNYLDIFISVEYCLPYWKQMNSIHN